MPERRGQKLFRRGIAVAVAFVGMLVVGLVVFSAQIPLLGDIDTGRGAL